MLRQPSQYEPGLMPGSKQRATIRLRRDWVSNKPLQASLRCLRNRDVADEAKGRAFGVNDATI
jgi:hypothetical protein